MPHALREKEWKFEGLNQISIAKSIQNPRWIAWESKTEKFSLFFNILHNHFQLEFIFKVESITLRRPSYSHIVPAMVISLLSGLAVSKFRRPWG
jgi:hypothetical protein